MEQLELNLTYTCKHTNATEPRYAGGNYGWYGWQKCRDCGAERDDYTLWHEVSSQRS